MPACVKGGHILFLFKMAAAAAGFAYAGYILKCAYSVVLPAAAFTADNEIHILTSVSGFSVRIHLACADTLLNIQ